MTYQVKILKLIRDVVYLFLFFSASVIAQVEGVEYGWEEKRNKDNIKIFTSDVNGSSFSAVRGEMRIKGTVPALVALVNDLPNCSSWADLCRESILIKAVSETEKFIYVYNDTPFPIKDRDVVVHVFWSKDKETNRVSMRSSAVKLEESEQLKPMIGSAVRLTDAVSQWHFTPLDDGYVLVENFAHIDPNGPTPAWITNLLLVESPFKTMKNMREIIQAGKYSDEIERF